MKKILKISIVLLIIGSFFGMQNVQGVFQFEIGDKVAFEIVRAGHDITVSTTADRFIGCSNSGTILDNGTVIVVEVMNVTSTELKWNTTNLSPTIIGTCFDDINEMTYINFLTDMIQFISTEFNFGEIITSGVIDPIYFVPFEVPLFVDPKPETWILFGNIEGTAESLLASTFGGWTILANDVIHSEVNNLMNLSLVFAAANIIDVDNDMALFTATLVSYNMTSGALQEAFIYYTVYGKYSGVSFITYSEYKIKQTDVPTEPFNFLNFLKENKWYFIGGGAGVVAIGAIIGITVGVKKARASRKRTKKSTKKKK
ncbi:MAG: hypothetical protein FK731_07815 [Asgard group archaeon]|nr:hypothetical protein [Asgard group archaeon]